MISKHHLCILVVEDNASFAQLLALLLKEIGVGKYLIAHTFDTGLQLFQSEAPDLCILDVELGSAEPNGVQLAEQIRALNPAVPIIYLSSHYSEDYYQKTQHTKPSGFMGKEISRFKLEVAIDMALWVYSNPKEAVPLNLEGGGNKLLNPTDNPFFFRIGDTYQFIPVKEIKYFYADKKLTYARVGNRNLPTNVSLKVLEETFQGYFARIHKTYLANIDLIESINPKEGSIVVGGETLRIGHGYRKQFLMQLKLLR